MLFRSDTHDFLTASPTADLTRISNQFDGRVVRRIAFGALAFRIVSAFIAVLANVLFPLYQREQFTVFGSTSKFWDTFARYDSGWYAQIAQHGYVFVPGGPSAGIGKPGKIAFFPLYPLLMRWIGALFGDNPETVYFAGIVISWASFVAASVALYFLARLDLNPRQSERAVLLTAIFPFSFFFGMVYTEALFLLLSILAFYGFRTRRWMLGGIAGGLATMTRPTGILILPALAWIVYKAVEPTWRDRVRAVTGLILVASGVGTYSLYIYNLSGNPFEWAASIQRWGYHVGNDPWSAPARLIGQLATQPYAYLLTDRMAPYDILYGTTAIAFVLLTPVVWVKFGAGYGLLMLLNLMVPLSSGTFEGMGRYCSVLFPAFMALATIRSRSATSALTIGFALFYTLALALFVTIHPLF